MLDRLVDAAAPARRARCAARSLRGHRAHRGARLRRGGRPRRLGQEHLPAPSRARLVVLPGRGGHRPRAARGRAARATCAGAAPPAWTPAPPAPCAAPYVLDATRCISYLTIELKGAIPEEQREGVGRHVFGCDICQDVCPWNRRRQQPAAPRSRRATGLVAPALEELADRPGRGALPRASSAGAPSSARKRRGLLRNVAVALGNSGDRAERPCWNAWPRDEDPLVREHAEWALRRSPGVRGDEEPGP